jgi:hypothetical protein
MTVSRLHGLYAVKIGATTLGGIRSRALRTASEIRQMATSGEVYARFGALYAQKPAAEFSTLDLKNGLAACGITGTAMTSAAPLILYGQKQLEGGSRMSGSNHRLWTMNEGILIPRRIVVEHQGDAAIDYEALITYDGTNDPIVITDLAALPAAPLDDYRYTLGKFSLTDDAAASYSFTEKLRLELDFGISAETHGADSDLWDTNARIVEVMPSLTISGKDLEWFKSTMVPLVGRTVRHNGTEIILQRRQNRQTFYSNVQAQHLKLTIAGQAVIEQVASASGNGVDETSLRIPLQFDGTNAPVVITADSTYT